jgi:hypothetical protein
MRLGPQQAYFNCMVRICRANGTPVGAGVIVAEDTILTCAHVVADALESPRESTFKQLGKAPSVFVHRVFLDGEETDPVECQLTHYISRAAKSATRDMAMLTAPTGRYPTSGKNAISSFSSHNPVIDEKIKVWGFPLDAARKIGQTVVANYHLTDHMPNQWLTAEANSGLGDEIRPGFSGAPVMHENSGHLIGIVCEADQSRRTATIIPVSLLQELTDLQFHSPDVAEKQAIHSDEPPVILSENNSALRVMLEWFFPSLHYQLTVRLRLFSDPPERRVLEKRLRDRHTLWSKELRGKTYLPPPAKEVPKAPYQMQGNTAKFFSPIQQLIKEVAGVSTGGDSASAQIAALSKKSKQVRSLVKRLERSISPLIVLGDPGAGKSITLKQVAIAINSSNSHRVYPVLCLFVPLGRWEPVENPTSKDVEDLVAQYAGPSLAPLLSGLAERRRLVVIFDGMDEMSRQKYNEHTQALHDYADKYHNEIKTLFSCRIADFSPAFNHSQLVLMPFSRRHITNYLIQQFGKTSLTVSGEMITTKELGARLSSRQLPIQPQNPFSLWLLALYLREKAIWPDTRTELLKFLYDYQYQRKRDESKDATHLWPSQEQLFRDWGKLALLITQRNLGTDIGIHEVRALFGQRTDAIVEAGRACSVLQQSLDHDPPLIRFEHHRAQEYFTARGVVESGAQIDWAVLLDLPRWQETLVNVAQMDSKSAPLSVLTEKLNEIGVEESEDDTDSDDEDERDTPSAEEQVGRVTMALQESRMAEQVELSTRVLRAVSKTEEAAQLEQAVSNASLWLVTHGNPTSQVKMLRLTDRLPDQGKRDIVDKAMKSRVEWVRNQANEIVASLAGSVTASPLPIEVANAYADGSILTAIKSRMKIARRLKSKGLAVVSGISFLLLIVQMLVMASLAPLVAHGISDRLAYVPAAAQANTINERVKNQTMSQDQGRSKIDELQSAAVFFRDWMPILILAVSIVALIGSIIWLPGGHWAITTAVGFVFLFLSTLAYNMWIFAPDTTFGQFLGGALAVVIGGALFVAIGTFVLFLTAFVITIFFATILATSLWSWTGQREHFFSTYRAVINNGEFAEYGEALLGLWAAGLIMVISSALLSGAIWAFKYISESDAWWARLLQTINDLVPDIPFTPRLFDYASTGLLLISAVSLVWTFIVFMLQKTFATRYVKMKNSGIGITLGNFLASIVAVLIGIGFTGFFTLLNYLKLKIGDFSVSWLLIGLVYLVGAALAIVALALVSSVAFKFWKKYAHKVANWTTAIDEYSFKAIMTRGDVEQQAHYLEHVDPKDIGLTANKFYELLVNIEPHIQKEPAVSKYYRKRIKLEDILRQERSA